MNNHLQEFEDRRVWALDGQEVTRLCLDYRFTIEIWWREGDGPDNSVSIAIGTPFVVLRDGEEFNVVPERVNSLSPALDILHKAVDSLTAYRDGRLVLLFADATEIRVDKHPIYESWATHGRGKLEGIGMLCSGHEGSPWGE